GARTHGLDRHYGRRVPLEPRCPADAGGPADQLRQRRGGRRPAPGGDLVPGEPLRLRAEGAGGGGEGGHRSGAEFSGCAAGQQYVDETLEGVARGQDATSQERCHAPPSCNLTSRSEEHTSELQSLRHLVCRLLLEKKKHKK